MELYQKIRRAVMIDGMSRRWAARYFGIDRKTVDKMLVFPESPQHGRPGRTYSRKLAGFTGGITIVRDYVATAKLRSCEVFIPLSHKSGHAEVRLGCGRLWLSCRLSRCGPSAIYARGGSRQCGSWRRVRGRFRTRGFR